MAAPVAGVGVAEACIAGAGRARVESEVAARLLSPVLTEVVYYPDCHDGGDSAPSVVPHYRLRRPKPRRPSLLSPWTGGRQ